MFYVIGLNCYKKFSNNKIFVCYAAVVILYDCFRNAQKEWCTKICLKISTPSFFHTEVCIIKYNNLNDVTFWFIVNC